MGQVTGQRKHGRDKVKCASYRMRHKREKSKIRRLSKLLRKAERLGWGNISQLKGAIQRTEAKKTRDFEQKIPNVWGSTE